VTKIDQNHQNVKSEKIKKTEKVTKHKKSENAKVRK